MPVKIQGKDYSKVDERINDFKTDNPDYSLESEILENGETILMKATVKDKDGRVMSTGHAEEVRGSSYINKTSALENCETSAWGRALAAMNYGGDSVASAEEVSNAIINQRINEAVERIKKHNQAVRDNILSIAEVKKCFEDENFDSAAEAFYEISEEDRMSLSLATTKGGIFSIDDSKKFMDDRWKEAAKNYHNNENMKKN